MRQVSERTCALHVRWADDVDHAPRAPLKALIRRQDRAPECLMIRVKSGIGPPQNVFCHSGGSGNRSDVSSRYASRSCSSRTCRVPTLRAGSLPSRIHRRMVSGWRPARLAASGTVNIVVANYKMNLAKACASPTEVSRP